MKYLLIGGSHDGQQYNIEDNAMTINLPVKENVKIPNGDKVETKLVEIMQEKYIKIGIDTSIEEGLYIFKLFGIPDKQVLFKLITNYRPQ